ncbi:Uncharacterised protein [Vibrio cholerae]|nr:Uncharacterised protein [Vibrio cholerae]
MAHHLDERSANRDWRADSRHKSLRWLCQIAHSRQFAVCGWW